MNAGIVGSVRCDLGKERRGSVLFLGATSLSTTAFLHIELRQRLGQTPQRSNSSRGEQVSIDDLSKPVKTLE
jgi:hypothetical protein